MKHIHMEARMKQAEDLIYNGGVGMTVSQLVKEIGLKVVTKEDFEDREIKGCFAGDLLSWVMGRAKPDSAWITIMTNINITAVASLVDLACIIIAEGASLGEDIIEKANEQNIIILSSDKPCYETAVAINKATGL